MTNSCCLDDRQSPWEARRPSVEKERLGRSGSGVQGNVSQCCTELCSIAGRASLAHDQLEPESYPRDDMPMNTAAFDLSAIHG